MVASALIQRRAWQLGAALDWAAARGQPPPGYGQQPPPGYGQQPPPGYGQQPPPGYGYQVANVAPPRRKRRVFLWVFLAIQALFIIWIIGGLVSTGHTAPSAAEMAQYCGNGPKSVLALYQNKADCMTHYSRDLSDAAGAGRGIGIALVVVFWCVVDFLVGGGYAIYRLATRSR